jgi:hypothetical protein
MGERLVGVVRGDERVHTAKLTRSRMATELLPGCTSGMSGMTIKLPPHCQKRWRLAWDLVL